MALDVSQSEVGTSATVGILRDWGDAPHQLASELWRLLFLTSYPRVPSDAQETAHVRIDPYTPFLPAVNSWLPAVEARIRNSVLPPDYDGEVTPEWITASAAQAAISFFRSGADLLPSEPHIYATISGDLVAEFEFPTGNLTGVVSERETVLFAVRIENMEPIHGIIPRGSNHYRDDLWSFMKKLASGTHGKMEAKR